MVPNGPNAPLYFTGMLNENARDYWKIGGQWYSHYGSYAVPPQGTTTSDIIHWTAYGSDSPSGWQMCIASGLQLGYIAVIGESLGKLMYFSKAAKRRKLHH